MISYQNPTIVLYFFLISHSLVGQKSLKAVVVSTNRKIGNYQSLCEKLFCQYFISALKRFSTILMNPVYWSLWVSGQLYLTQSQGQASYDLWTEFNWPSRELLKLRKRKFHHTPLLPSEKSSHTEKSTKVIGNYEWP